MPLHAQIFCIGGNGLFALLFLVAAAGANANGDGGLTLFLLGMAIAAGYSVWVLLKFRRYLSAEGELERELHIERLREEIDRLKANNAPDA
jgi:hypothetical protein